MKISIIGTFIVSICTISCTKYVDIKPDKKMTVPQSFEDCDALMDDRSTMNSRFPVGGEVASDNYYLAEINYNALTSIVDRDAYLWNSNTNFATNQWSSSYKAIMAANQVLEILNKLKREDDRTRYDRLKGEALFFRAYALSQLAPVFAPTYRPESAEQTLGLVLRFSSAIDYVSVRSDLLKTYRQIVADLKEAVSLLPVDAIYKTRPTKLAAWATLSRIGLVISDFELAISASKEVLNQGVGLLDYNTVNAAAANPFGRFNPEVLFHAATLTSVCLNPSVSKIDSMLYRSYLPDDLRKGIYFKNNNNGTYAFKGRYDGDINAASFAGVGLDEVYLNYAEALVRTNKLQEGLNVFNALMQTRWKTNTYVPFSSDVKESVLSKILEERRKSLIMRNLRWSDIRRLNSYGGNINLKRIINGETYYLNAGDPRFTFLIPSGVMEYAPEIIQNPR